MRWIYLSPHLDDAAFSCGGLIWEQAQAGYNVHVWTVCAGDAPVGALSLFAESLHERWGSGTNTGQIRRQEDLRANEILGAVAHQLPIPDCIYRRHPSTGDYLYTSEESLFGQLHPAEQELVENLAEILGQAILEGQPADMQPGINLVCPLGLGGHVDHQLARQAVERMACTNPACRSWYYADFPYVLEDATLLSEMPKGDWGSVVFPVTGAGLQAWQAAMAAHSSQVSTFWDGVEDMKTSIQAYCRETGGVRLWHKENHLDE
jgi:LmbE family N-acetylglucosaminyl deacetylase